MCDSIYFRITSFAAKLLSQAKVKLLRWYKDRLLTVRQTLNSEGRGGDKDLDGNKCRQFPYANSYILSPLYEF